MALDDALHALILEYVSDAVVGIDGDGRVTYWNQSAQRLYGLTEAQVLGRPLNEAYVYEWQNPTDQMAAWAALDRSGFWHGENVHICRDGARIHVESAVLARKDPNGRITELLAIIHDRSETKRAERRAAESDARTQRAHETLQQSESRLRLVLESIADHAIFTMDPSRRIDSWNTAAQRTFGYTAEEAIGKSGDIIFTPEDRAAGAPVEEMVQARDTGRATDERWHLRKDGSRLFVSGILSPLRDARGELSGYVKITRDLTERKEWEDRLQRANDDLEQRVAERTDHVEQLLRKLVSVQEDERRRIARDIHDHLGQQMTALRLNLASLRDSTVEHPALRAQVERIENLAATMDAGVDFLAWELRPGVLEDLGLAAALSDFVREWSAYFRIRAEFHAAAMTSVRLPPDVESNMYRVAQEALNNVSKHAEASRVSVVLEQHGGRTVMIVEDDGKGFDPAEVHGRPERDRGLGLIGMRERVALIRGRLEIESAPGRGTTIFVEGPAGPAPDSAEV